jgi:nitrate reductase gamma subunit
MAYLIEFATGPLFTFSISLMILGLLRLILITVLDIRKALKNAGDKNIPYLKVVKETIQWMIPWKNTIRTQPFFSIVSFIFHIGLVLAPLFLMEHIIIWRKVFGFGWPAIGKPVIDILALLTVIGGIILLGLRIISRKRRDMSSAQDYLLLIFILVLFISGHFISRPYNPLEFETAMLIHAMCGNFLLILFPFTRLSHCVLYPLLRLASTVAWHFPRNAGRDFNKLLYGQEKKKI